MLEQNHVQFSDVSVHYFTFHKFSSLWFSLNPKLHDRQSFSSANCSRQEHSESTSLLTLPLSLLPLISFAKLTALKFGVIIFVHSFVEVMITVARNHYRHVLFLWSLTSDLIGILRIWRPELGITLWPALNSWLYLLF